MIGQYKMVEIAVAERIRPWWFNQAAILKSPAFDKCALK